MDSTLNTPFSEFLASPDQADGVGNLAARWADATVVLRLQGAAVAAGRREFGTHLRRSFLGGLGRCASPQASRNEVCPWDPPCALDVFGREQLRDARFRGDKGDGLPKPYIVGFAKDDGDALVWLRMFGVALDWLPAAEAALILGLREILPWRRVGLSEAPLIVDRSTQHVAGLSLPPAEDALRLVFMGQVDASGVNVLETPASLVSRLIRRVDGLARWQQLKLGPEIGQSLSAHCATLDYDVSGLRSSHYKSPNAKKEKRTKSTLVGQMVIRGDLDPVIGILMLGERTGVGRGTVEGLGQYRLDFGEE